LIAKKLLVTDDPGGRAAPPAKPLFCPYPPATAPLAHGEFGLADELCKLVGAVPVLGGLLAGEQGQGGFDFVKPLQQRLNNNSVNDPPPL
jgi:hypothetical protein